MTLKPLELDVYTAWTDEAVVYSESTARFMEREPVDQHDFLNLLYLSLALSGEVGEVQNIIKKLLRNDVGKVSPEAIDALSLELGDVFFYLIRLVVELGLDPLDVLQQNIDKLEGRINNGDLYHT